MMLLTNWAAVWEIAGMGVGVVFTILILLVFVLQIFSMIAGKSAEAAAPAANEAEAAPTAPTAEELEMVSIAVAMWLNYNSSHDQDSGKLTIANDDERWHEVLNPSL